MCVCVVVITDVVTNIGIVDVFIVSDGGNGGNV